MKIGNNFAFNKFNAQPDVYEFNAENATVAGVSQKTGILLGVTLLTSLFLMGIMVRLGYFPILLYAIAGISTFVFQLIIIFSPMKAKALAIPYAISEGLVIGSICGILQLLLGDLGSTISMIAFVATLSVFIAGLFLYVKGYVQVGRRFIGFLLAATIGLAIFSLCILILSLVSLFSNGPSFFDMFYMGGLGIAISILSCVIAAMYVIFSFENANTIVESGAHKDMEWYAAYAITLNVIYLFLEILRLVIILFARNNKD